MFDRAGAAGAFPAYRQQLKQGALCLVPGGRPGSLPPVRQHDSRFVDHLPIPPFAGAIHQIEYQHGVQLRLSECVIKAAHLLDARFAVFQIKCVDECPHGRTPFPSDTRLGNDCFRAVSSPCQIGFVARRRGPKAHRKFGYPKWVTSDSLIRSRIMQIEATMKSRSDKLAMLIDGPNLYAAAKSLGFEIDFKRLLVEFEGRGTVLRAMYYSAIAQDKEFSGVRPLLDWLAYNGYNVVTKATKEFIDAGGRRKVKGNMDIELAVDAMELAGHVDQIILFSGDGDFRSLVEAVQRRGVRVTVVSTVSGQPPMIATELRRQANVFTDLVELQSRICRA